MGETLEGPTPIPTGEMILAGLRTYFAGIPRGAPDFSSAVVLACDVSGYADPKIRDLANKIARNGYYVVVPDFCRGDPFVTDPSGGGGQPFAAWLEDHNPLGDAFEDAKLVCKLLGYFQNGVGAIGIGWGAKVVAELAMPRPPMNGYYITSAVLLDPFSVTLDDFKGGYVPTLVSGAEINHDDASPQPSRLFEELSDALATEPEIVRLVKLVPDIANGWSLRHNSDDEEAVEREKKVFTDIVDWFGKYITIYARRWKFASIYEDGIRVGAPCLSTNV